jgi:hypothetical protein
MRETYAYWLLITSYNMYYDPNKNHSSRSPYLWGRPIYEALNEQCMTQTFSGGRCRKPPCRRSGSAGTLCRSQWLTCSTDHWSTTLVWSGSNGGECAFSVSNVSSCNFCSSTDCKGSTTPDIPARNQSRPDHQKPRTHVKLFIPFLHARGQYRSQDTNTGKLSTMT